MDGGIREGDRVAYGIGTKTLGLRDREFLDEGIVDTVVVANHFVFRHMTGSGAEGRRNPW